MGRGRLYRKLLIAGFLSSFYITILATGVVIVASKLQELFDRRLHL